MYFTLFGWGFASAIVVAVMLFLGLVVVAAFIGVMPRHSKFLGVITRGLARFAVWLNDDGEDGRAYIATAMIAGTVLSLILWWSWPIPWLSSWWGWGGFFSFWAFAGAVLVTDYLRSKRKRSGSALKGK